MCGRFTLTSSPEELARRFGLDDAAELVPRYNIAPGQDVLAVRADADGRRRADGLRWGLVPPWAPDPSVGSRMINAKGETLAEKSSFRNAFKKRRCLVLADGFYEWRKEGKDKIPTYIFQKSREPFAFAGLWETWKSPEDEVIRSCTIITTEPNAYMSPIHNRMPVLLSEEAEALWLDPMTEELKCQEYFPEISPILP